MPVIGSDNEILKQYLGPNALGNAYLGSTQVQFGNVSVVETPYYWFDPSVNAYETSWTSSNAASATDGELLVYKSNNVLQKSEPPTQYYDLSGVSDQIQSGTTMSELDFSNSNPQGKTFIWWINVDEADYTQGDGSAAILVNGTSNINWSINLAQNAQGTGSYFRPDGNPIAVDTDVAIPYSGSGEWVMMAMNVYTEGDNQIKIKGYLNDTNVTDYNSGEQFSTETVNRLLIGYADVGPVSNESRSKIGDVLIYTSSLDDGEISQTYKALKPKYV